MKTFFLFFFFILHWVVPKCLFSGEMPPAVIVVFGATGDLTTRKVMPALYNLAEVENFLDHFAVVGIGRRDYSSHKFRELMREGVEKFSRTKCFDEKWNAFEKKLFYHRADFDSDEGYEKLKTLLQQIDQEWGTKGNRLFYLATHSDSFATIIAKLYEHGLIYKTAEEKWSRVVLEKPFGRDLDSAQQMQGEISKYLDESQIYLVDHYLGKAAVQNLFTLRFKNAVFEPLWNKQYIDHVQITISEEIGIGSRAHFWEETGLLRDIFQNHMMQLLSIVAMEQPAALRAEEIHAEKIRLLKAVRPFSQNDVVRGQYAAGEVKGERVPGYREEKGVPEDSNVETFVAAKLFIDNERWRSVPFYLRSGKRLDVQGAEIIVSFKNSSNELIVRIQPDPGVFLRIVSDASGLNALMAYQWGPSPEAYEKLLFDGLRGDHSLFVDAEEQIAAWKILAPVMKRWNHSSTPAIPQYVAGTQGPKEVKALMDQSSPPLKQGRE